MCTCAGGSEYPTPHASVDPADLLRLPIMSDFLSLVESVIARRPLMGDKRRVGAAVFVLLAGSLNVAHGLTLNDIASPKARAIRTQR